MWIIQIALFPLWLTSSAVMALQCYQCDSAINGIEACDDSSEHKGELINCPAEESRGCYIVETILGEKSTVARGCTSLEDESKYICDTHKAGSYVYTSCNCHGDGCNEDWNSAGQSSALECYECNTMDNEEGCSDTASGELTRCGPGDKGCFISRATYGADVAYERGCTEISDESLYKCQTVTDNHGDNALHYCNCHGTGCNKDWSSAEGGDNQPTTSKPDGPTVKCYSCTSADGGCTDLEHGESTIDCPAIKGCRIAKTLDNGHGEPTWVRGCSMEEESGCEESVDGISGGNVLACICKTELCNENWVAAGSSTTNQGQWTDPPTGAPGAGSTIQLSFLALCLMTLFLVVLKL